MKYTKPQRLRIGQRICEGEYTVAEAAQTYSISFYTAREYLRTYKAYRRQSDPRPVSSDVWATDGAEDRATDGAADRSDVRVTDGTVDRSGVRVSASAAAGAPAIPYAAVPVHDASVSVRAASGDSAAGDSAAGDSPVWPAAVSDRHAPAFACDAAGAPRRPAAPADTMREDDLTACGRERTAAPADTMREDDLTACGREQTTASAAAMRKEDPTSGGGADPPDSEARFRRISARMSREELEEAYVTLRVREERIRQVLE